MLSDVVGVVERLEESSSDESFDIRFETWLVHCRVVFPAESVAADLVAHCDREMRVLLQLVLDIAVPHLLHHVSLAAWVALLAVAGVVSHQLPVPVAGRAVAGVAGLLAGAASILARVAAAWNSVQNLH